MNGVGVPSMAGFFEDAVQKRKRGPRPNEFSDTVRRRVTPTEDWRESERRKLTPSQVQARVWDLALHLAGGKPHRADTILRYPLFDVALDGALAIRPETRGRNLRGPRRAAE